MTENVSTSENPTMKVPVLMNEHTQFINAMMEFLDQAGELQLAWWEGNSIRSTFYDLKHLEAYKLG